MHDNIHGIKHAAIVPIRLGLGDGEVLVVLLYVVLAESGSCYPPLGRVVCISMLVSAQAWLITAGIFYIRYDPKMHTHQTPSAHRYPQT